MFGFGTNRKRISELETEVAALREAAPRNLSLDDLAILGGVASFAGPTVTPDSAMRAAAVFACTRLLSEAIAGLSLPVYERLPDGARRRAPAEAYGGIWWLLNEQPTPSCSAASFWEWMVRDSLLAGDGIAALGRNRNGGITEVIPVPRRRTVIERKDSRLRYYVQTDEGFFGFDQDDVLHFPGFGFDGTGGMSVIRYAAHQAIGIALGAEEWAGRFFSNGALPKFALEVPGALKEKQADDLRKEWIARYSGAANAHLPLVLTHGAKASPLSLNAEDAQLLQTRQFQVVDIARAFGVPPFMIGETEKTSSWGTGIEAMGLGFVRYTLRGILTRFEQEMNRKFWPRSQRYFVEYNTESLMRGDSAAEAAYFRNALGGAQGAGWLSVDEVRRIKNLPPVPGGDRVYFPEGASDGSSNVSRSDGTGDREGPAGRPAPAPGRG